MPAGEHLARVAEQIPLLFQIQPTRRHRAVVREIIAVLLNIQPADRHHAVGTHIIADLVNIQPADRHRAVRIKIIALAVDLLPLRCHAAPVEEEIAVVFDRLPAGHHLARSAQIITGLALLQPAGAHHAQLIHVVPVAADLLPAVNAVAVRIKEIPVAVDKLPFVGRPRAVAVVVPPARLVLHPLGRKGRAGVLRHVLIHGDTENDGVLQGRVGVGVSQDLRFGLARLHVGHILMGVRRVGRHHVEILEIDRVLACVDVGIPQKLGAVHDGLELVVPTRHLGVVRAVELRAVAAVRIGTDIEIVVIAFIVRHRAQRQPRAGRALLLQHARG